MSLISMFGTLDCERALSLSVIYLDYATAIDRTPLEIRGSRTRVVGSRNKSCS